MTYQLLSVNPQRDGTFSIVVLLLSGDKAPTRRRLAVPAEDYAEAGSPSAGTMLFAEDYAILTKSTDRKEAIERAYKILAFGDNSKKALEAKLRQKGFSALAAKGAVSYMEKKGFLKEEELLFRRIGECVNSRLYGKRKTLQTLLQKGFSAGDITSAIEKMESTGEIDFEAAKAALLRREAPSTPEEKRKLLFKYGF